jgi:hypothetical protein
VVVYKVDRLTCSLADFAKLVELFDQYEVLRAFATRAPGHSRCPAWMLIAPQLHNMLLPACWFSAAKRGQDSLPRSARAPRRTQRSPKLP